jgi:O-antigen/teichoic acid export membrane protein
VGVRGSSPQSFEQLTFVLVAAGYQVCLNSAPLVLAWRLEPGLRVAVGAFVIASSYYRLAAVLGGGFATQTLVSLSRLWAAGQQAAFAKQLVRGVLGAGAVTAAATAAAAAAGPWVVPLLNGRDPHISGVVVAALAVSTVLATAASVATAGLMASHHGRSAAVWWMAGSAAHVAVLAMADTIGPTTAVALLVGPGIVLVGVATTMARVATAWAPQELAP